MYYIGYDIGSSSVKAALVDGATRKTLAVVQHPDREMAIEAPFPGWAEQAPEMWWQSVQYATKKLLKKVNNVDVKSIAGIGLGYQMHGLVLIDKDREILRPAIIWCDSRAVGIGKKTLSDIGEKKCLQHVLNSPGNFTASKLKWVQEHEPQIYDKVDKIMLPGDFIAMKMTDNVSTTVPGLSEGILWDFKNGRLAELVLQVMDIEPRLIPDVQPTFSVSGTLTSQAAALLGLPSGIPVAYRAGDQPNNALALGVLEPGQIAATGGTSGVVFGVSDGLVYDPLSRINSFAHVNHSTAHPRIGSLLNINGAGIEYKWIKNITNGDQVTYSQMEEIATQVEIGADGVRVLPFGNGAERIFENRDPGGQVLNLQFNRHDKRHLYRASLEGIAFSFVYGMKILQSLGTPLHRIRVGNDNLFQSKIFSSTIASLVDCTIEMIQTTGAAGAAKGAAFTLGNYKDLQEATGGNELIQVIEPINDPAYHEAYDDWCRVLCRNGLAQN